FVVTLTVRVHVQLAVCGFEGLASPARAVLVLLLDLIFINSCRKTQIIKSLSKPWYVWLCPLFSKKQKV
ncbi:hypothetical protein, partial [Klebsiella oxytoca]|uniref:hypothetical protein n=1 Tax=Klebsiella oxytoca TaxID=571 RepID=UPI00387A1464